MRSEQEHVKAFLIRTINDGFDESLRILLIEKILHLIQGHLGNCLEICYETYHIKSS
jgi:hypothetical protein